METSCRSPAHLLNTCQIRRSTYLLKTCLKITCQMPLLHQVLLLNLRSRPTSCHKERDARQDSSPMIRSVFLPRTVSSPATAVTCLPCTKTGPMIATLAALLLLATLYVWQAWVNRSDMLDQNYGLFADCPYRLFLWTIYELLSHTVAMKI